MTSVSSIPFRVAIIGAGNVATHLAMGFHRAGCRITEVVSRDISHAAALAAKVGARASDDVSLMDGTADYVVISVSDSAVAEVSSVLGARDAVVVHTSGSVPIEALSANHRHAGVLYPLQTFSRDVPVDISRVPFFTEGSTADTLEKVDVLARLLSADVYHADSSKRKLLHIAGVLSSNFTVYLLGRCAEVLAAGGYPLEVVRPLVEATMSKTFAVGPHDAMTGPARRGDMAVVDAQCAAVPDRFRPIYRLISDNIYKEYHQ